MIKTKSIYRPKEKEDGIRILVTRFYPRGVRKDHFDQWLRELAPSKDLLKQYKAGNLSKEQFTVQFLDQISSDGTSRAAIREISEMAKITNVTLLCYEHDGDFCHRHLLYDVITSRIKNQLLPAWFF